MSKFSDKEFILLNRAKDLYIYTSEAVGNEKVIPRRRRYPTGQRLETMAMEILQKCHLANTTDLHRAFEERQRLQTEVIALCLTLEQLIDALKASKAYPGINQHKADIWIQHSLDVRYGVTGNWNGIYCDILMGIGLYRAVNWWLRSPNSSNNNNAYNVNTDGSVNNNNVYNGNNCARPALAGKYAEIR